MTDPTLEPELQPTPSAEQVRQIMRRQNIKLGLAAVLLAVVGGVGIYYSAASRAASDDSYNATAVQLADNERGGCITERRNAELDAIGRALVAGLRAQVAALVNDDTAEALVQVRLFDQAAKDRDAAADALSPDVLNQPPPVGCGPVITSVERLPDEATSPAP